MAPNPDPEPDSPDVPRPPRKGAAKPKPETAEFDLFSGLGQRRPTRAPATPSPRAAAPSSQPAPAASPTPAPAASRPAAQAASPQPFPGRTDAASAPARGPAPAPEPGVEKPAPTPSPLPLSSAPVPPTSTGTRPMAHSPNLEDFRRNADRQSREQKSFGNVLATITYSILVAFILVTGLAAYGGYLLFQRIKLQSESIAEIDRRYEAEVVGLKEDQKRAHDEIERLGDDLGRQQEQIARLRAVDDKLTSDLASERAAGAAWKTQLQTQLDQLAGRR